jgi:outer membrane protein OmpA-like peptidoglycan-associated protein
MKHIIILLSFFASLQTGIAQYTTADLVYKCDFEPNDPFWKSYNEKGFTSGTVKGKFILQHAGKDEAWNQTNSMNFDPHLDYEVEVSMCQLSGVENQGYGISYNYKDVNNSNTFCISPNGYFSVFHYTKGIYKDDIAWKESDRIIKGHNKYNKLAIARKGNNLHYFINGVEVASLPVPKYNAEYVGFHIGGVMKVEADYVYMYQKKKPIRLVDNYNSFGEKIHLGANINSTAAEICPVISADEKTLFITRTFCKENTAGEDDYDIWVSQLNKDETWTKLKNIGPPLNNKGNNFVISVSHDNNSLVIGNVYHGGDGKDMTKGISYSHKTKTGWSYPKEMKIKNFYNNNDYNEACLSPDGKTILLCIERDDTHGDKDLYFSHLLSDSSWSEPENLGAIVNTYSNETGVFLASDNKTMYFSSAGHPGYGSNDIFMSKRLDDTWKHWSEPKNLGPKINTKAWDVYYTMPASGKYAYMVSEAKQNEKADIFKIQQPESVKPDPVILVHGVVHNSDTKKPMQAVVTYYELGSKKVLGKATSNIETGAFTIALPKGRKYCFNAQHEGFISVNANTDATVLDTYKEENIDLYLSPVKTGQSVVLHNLFFVSDEHRILPESFPELDKLHDLLVEHPEMKIEISGHTSINSSGEKYNHDLSTGRAEAVKKYLISKGISEKRITAKGFGFSKPIYTDKTEAHQALNRRIEFVIVSS